MRYMINITISKSIKHFAKLLILEQKESVHICRMVGIHTLCNSNYVFCISLYIMINFDRCVKAGNLCTVYIILYVN